MKKDKFLVRNVLWIHIKIWKDNFLVRIVLVTENAQTPSEQNVIVSCIQINKFNSNQNITFHHFVFHLLFLFYITFFSIYIYFRNEFSYNRASKRYFLLMPNRNFVSVGLWPRVNCIGDLQISDCLSTAILSAGGIDSLF